MRKRDIIDCRDTASKFVEMANSIFVGRTMIIF